MPQIEMYRKFISIVKNANIKKWMCSCSTIHNISGTWFYMKNYFSYLGKKLVSAVFSEQRSCDHRSQYNKDLTELHTHLMPTCFNSWSPRILLQLTRLGVWCWCSLGTSICWLADYHWRWSTSPNLDPVSSAIIVQGSTAKNSLQGLPPTFASRPPCATFASLLHVGYPDTVKSTYNMMLDLGQKKKHWQLVWPTHCRI